MRVASLEPSDPSHPTAISRSKLQAQQLLFMTTQLSSDLVEATRPIRPQWTVVVKRLWSLHVEDYAEAWATGRTYFTSSGKWDRNTWSRPHFN